VCFDGDEVLGGGWIARQQAINPRERVLVPAGVEEDEEIPALEGGCGAKR
jgi:hypothetical protein